MGTLPNLPPTGVRAPTQALQPSGIPPLAQNPSQQVDSNRGTALLQISRGKLADHAAHHIQHHRSLGTPGTRHRADSPLQLLILNSAVEATATRTTA